MTITIARQMLKFPREENCCALIFAHEDEFVWDEHGDEVDVWNRIAAERGFESVEIEDDDNDDTYLVQGERRLKVPLRFERGDNTISVHTLGLLLLPAVELRMCLDTGGNSEYAFMALTPDEWLELENEFGKEGVEYRFLQLGASVDELWETCSTALDAREWY